MGDLPLQCLGDGRAQGGPTREGNPRLLLGGTPVARSEVLSGNGGWGSPEGKWLPCLTLRAADAALPRANVGGISAQNHTPTKAVGRRRRAADAIVRLRREGG